MSARDSISMSIPASPPPPASILSYSQFMHQHTKRQMEAASRSSHRRGGSSRHSQEVPTMPNGTSQESASSPGSVDYHD
jgi:hypothetical protein